MGEGQKAYGVRHRAAVGGPCQRQTVVCGWDIQTRQEAICSTAVHSCLHQERRPHQTSSLRICPVVRETWEGLQKGNIIAVNINQTLIKIITYHMFCIVFIL